MPVFQPCSFTWAIFLPKVRSFRHFRTLCGFVKCMKSQRKSPPASAIIHSGSGFVAQFALQSSLFPRSLSFGHLLSHCGFYHLAPNNIWRATPWGQQKRYWGTYCCSWLSLIMSAVRDLQHWTFAPWSVAGHRRVHINNSSCCSAPLPVMKQILLGSPANTVSISLPDFICLLRLEWGGGQQWGLLKISWVHLHETFVLEAGTWQEVWVYRVTWRMQLVSPQWLTGIDGFTKSRQSAARALYPPSKVSRWPSCGLLWNNVELSEAQWRPGEKKAGKWNAVVDGAALIRSRETPLPPHRLASSDSNLSCHWQLLKAAGDLEALCLTSFKLAPFLLLLSCPPGSADQGGQN